MIKISNKSNSSVLQKLQKKKKKSVMVSVFYEKKIRIKIFLMH